MKYYVRFQIEDTVGRIEGTAIADLDSPDLSSVQENVAIPLEGVQFATPDDAEAWAELDRAYGGDGKGRVMALPCELEILEGVVPGPNQPALFGEAT